jgi:hypothetical protein
MDILKIFKKPTVQDECTQKLREAEFALMDARNKADYYVSMIRYHEQVVRRLREAAHGGDQVRS